MPTVNDFVFREPAEKSREIARRDMQSISPSYTRSYGFTVSHGRGAKVWDVDGNSYIDFASGIAVLSTGYSHPRIVKAIQEQAEKYIHIGGTDFFSPEPVELAEKLQRLTPIKGAQPQDKRVYFGNSGAEAVESALKLARYATGRPYVIGFYGAFHGRTMGALSVTASKAIQRANYPYIPGGVEHVHYPNRQQPSPFGDPITYIKDVILKKKMPADEVAAIIVEPIQGEGGYIVPPDDFLPRLRELCDKYGILLIVDEIQSGVGRTGKWLAVEHFGVEPDIVCLAKGLGSGLPIGAIVAHVDVMGKWVPGAHASTFGGNPLSCKVASTTIDILEEENVFANVTAIGEYVLERLNNFKQNHPVLGRVDGKGAMIGMDFITADGEPYPEFRDKVVDEAYLNGLLTLGCGTSGIRFAPPLIISREEVEQGFDILEQAITTVESRLSAPVAK